MHCFFFPKNIKPTHVVKLNQFPLTFPSLHCILLIFFQIPEALQKVRGALKLKPDDMNSLHLLALLLSAQKQFSEALNVIEVAGNQYPDKIK